LGAAKHDDIRTARRKSVGEGPADPMPAARDQDDLAVQIDRYRCGHGCNAPP
jgi:hypothetical protein